MSIISRFGFEKQEGYTINSDDIKKLFNHIKSLEDENKELKENKKPNEEMQELKKQNGQYKEMLLKLKKENEELKDEEAKIQYRIKNDPNITSGNNETEKAQSIFGDILSDINTLKFLIKDYINADPNKSKEISSKLQKSVFDDNPHIDMNQWYENYNDKNHKEEATLIKNILDNAKKFKKLENEYNFDVFFPKLKIEYNTTNHRINRGEINITEVLKPGLKRGNVTIIQAIVNVELN